MTTLDGMFSYCFRILHSISGSGFNKSWIQNSLLSNKDVFIYPPIILPFQQNSKQEAFPCGPKANLRGNVTTMLDNIHC